VFKEQGTSRVRDREGRREPLIALMSAEGNCEGVKDEIKCLTIKKHLLARCFLHLQNLPLAWTTRGKANAIMSFSVIQSGSEEYLRRVL